MRNLVCILAICLSIMPTLSRAEVIPEGTIVPIRITNNLSSDLNCTVNAVVDADVIVNGIVAIARGTLVETSVLRKESGMAGRPGKIEVGFIGTESAEGKRVMLTGTIAAKGKSKRGVALGVGVGLGVFIWPCLYCLVIEGKEAVIPANTTVLTAMVAYPVE